MGKQLHILRHAKSSWSDGALSDRERGLNRRGRRDAPRMGAALAARLEPQSITASPARRAQLTLAGLIEGWPALQAWEHPCEEALYTFSGAELRDWLVGCQEARASVFILGHNPALTDLVNWLCGEPVLDNLPTAGYAGLELRCEHWAELAPGCAAHHECLFPKELGDG